MTDVKRESVPAPLPSKDVALPLWFSPQRFFINAPGQPPGTCFVLDSDFVLAMNEVRRLLDERQAYRALAGIGLSGTDEADELAAMPDLERDKEAYSRVQRRALATMKAVADTVRKQVTPPERDLGEIERLRAVAQAVVDWNTRYPSSRIYCEGEIRKIAAEMDVIFENAKAALNGHETTVVWACPDCRSTDLKSAAWKGGPDFVCQKCGAQFDTNQTEPL